MSHNPTEHVQQEIHHQATHGSGEKWITAAATTAILAALAAGAGALAIRHLTQSTLTRIKANDDWNYYQAKSVKSSLLDAKIYCAQLNKTEPRKADVDKKSEYATQMSEIQESAKESEVLSREHLESHETFEGSATLFHISIAIVAVAVVAKRRTFWYLSLVGGVCGAFFLVKGSLMSPGSLKSSKSERLQQVTALATHEGHRANESAQPHVPIAHVN
jgi:hypothetical protein